ncbi:exostoses (multiple)-like 2 [Trapelia coarctata]|nr:exostoses (multiple)-like 2 [Trapelia coarctata]
MPAPPPSPPPPPPLPPQAPKSSQTPLKTSSTISPFIQSLQEAPPASNLPHSPAIPPTGPYFCYGTLMDPSLLQGLLNLPTLPMLRPARIVEYTVKLWGPYPALFRAEGENAVDGANVVMGTVFEVESVEQAERLAEYETGAYRACPCRILYADGEEEAEGWTFMYVGNLGDVSEGVFDLGKWLGEEEEDEEEDEAEEEEAGGEMIAGGGT